MDQVSRPLLIALAAAVGLLAVWLVALRPKPPAVENTPAAPVTAIPKAKQAAAASDAANAKVQSAATAADGQTAAPDSAADASEAAPTTASEPTVADAATASDSRDAAVLRDIRAKKVVVMLFWNSKGADDVATRGVLRRLDRHGGKVAVHVAPIASVSQYGSVTRGVRVMQSPTTIVIDRKRQTRVITGLTESHELSQAVGDALAGR